MVVVVRPGESRMAGAPLLDERAPRHSPGFRAHLAGARNSAVVHGGYRGRLRDDIHGQPASSAPTSEAIIGVYAFAHSSRQAPNARTTGPGSS